MADPKPNKTGRNTAKNILLTISGGSLFTYIILDYMDFKETNSTGIGGYIDNRTKKIRTCLKNSCDVLKAVATTLEKNVM